MRDAGARMGLAMFALLSISAAWAHFALADLIQDDAYIHLRIAEHLAEFGVARFNLSEEVSGSSSPLWTVLLATLRLFAGKSSSYPIVLNATLLPVCVLGWSAVVSTAAGTRRSKLLPLVILGTFGACLEASLEGMETVLALALAGVGIALALRGGVAGALLLGLAAGVRVELAMLAVVFGAWTISRPDRVPKRAIPALVISLVVALSLQRLLFGEFLPRTALVKRAVYGLEPRESMNRVLNLLFEHFLGSLPRGFYALHALAVTISVVAVTVVGVRALADRQSEPGVSFGGALIVAGLGIMLTYVAAGALVFEWYVPLFLVPLMVGSILVAEGTGTRLATLVILATPAAILTTTALGVVENRAALAHYPSGTRAQRYREIGAALNTADPSAKLLAPEIGGLGYGFHGEILDALGLASADSVRYHPLPVPSERANRLVGAVPSDLIRDHRPEIVVGMEIFLRGAMASTAAAEYSAYSVRLFSLEPEHHVLAWGGSSISILVRRDRVDRLGDFLRNVGASPLE